MNFALRFDLIKMKFLVLEKCPCHTVAALTAGSVGGQGDQGHYQLHGDFKASLGYTDCRKQTKQTTKIKQGGKETK